MPMLRRLFGLWVIGKTANSTTTLVTRLIICMAAIAILATFAAVFTLLLIGSALWMLYTALVAYGFDTQNTILVLSGIILAMLGGTLYYVQCQVREIKNTSQHLTKARSPLTQKATDIAGAFMNGFFNSPARE